MIYQFNPFKMAEEDTPPQLREPIMISWQKVILQPINYLARIIFKDYFQGCNYPNYDNSTTYSKYDRVIWNDFGVYELRVASSTGVDPTGETLSATNWRKILNNFVGVDERVKWNSQLIVFEEAINRQFRVTAAPFIYVTEYVTGGPSVFVEINVPSAVYNTLGSNNAARSAKVYDFAKRYTLAGYQIQVTAY